MMKNKSIKSSNWLIAVCVLIGTCQLSTINCIGQITRTQIINNAVPYTTYTFTATSSNIKHSVSCSGVGNIITPSWVVVGNNTSMPYCWGGFSTLASFTSGLTHSKSAGDDDCTTGGDGSESCALGVDCSGFVSRTWGLATKQSTSSIPSISTALGSASLVQPGDCFNNAGSHVRLVETNYGNGNYRVIESSANGWHVAYNTYTASQLSSYVPRKYNNVAASSSCGTPSGLTASSVTLNSAILNWTAISGATSYNVQYKPSTSSTWTTVVATTTSQSINGLSASTAYQFQVQAVCSSTGSYSAAATFTTSTTAPANDNCSSAVTITPNTTCVSTSGTLAGATAGGLVKGSCDVNSGTPLLHDVWYQFQATASTQTVTCTPSSGLDAVLGLYTSCTGGQIGCSDNGGGAGGTEKIVATGLTVGTTYFVRIYSAGANAPATSTFNICVTGTTTSSCGTPASLSAGSVTSTGAILSWAAVSGATSYNVQYKPSTSSTWTTVTSSATSKSISGLSASTAYQFQVQAVCSNTGSYSSVATFTTLANTSTCGTPASLSASTVTSTSAVLNWSSVSGATSYNVQYKPSTSSTWTTIVSTTTSQSISGLSASTAYQFQVQAVCSNTGSYSSAATFTTLASSNSNDDCANAQILTPNATCVSTSGSVAGATSGGLPKASCDGYSGTPALKDVWYKFQATSTSHTIKVTPSASFDVVLSLYTSCSGGQIGCSDNGGGQGAAETINATNLTVGTTYYIRVYSYGATAPATATFTICVTTPNTNSTVNCDITLKTTIEGFKVYKHNPSGAIMFRAKMAIDADGSPRAYGPNNSGLDYTANAGSPGNWWGVVADNNGNPVIQGSGDPYPGMYVSTTSLINSSYGSTNPLRYANSEALPFFVLPTAVTSLGGISLGDIAYVYNTSTGLGCYAIFADGGPAGKLGEGSIYLANQLGLNSNARTGGTASAIIDYIVFPQSGSGQGTFPSVSQINSIGAAKINSVGGTSITDCLPPNSQLNNNTTGIDGEESNSESAFEVFPNPFDGKTLNGKFSDAVNQQMTIQILDMLGREIFAKEIFVEAGSFSLSLDSYNLQPGMYVFMGAANGNRYKKMLVVR